MATDKGYVYILSNPSFKENWVKIGMTGNSVEQRVAELDTTGVPLPFEIFAKMRTSHYMQAEKHIHKMIDRLASGKRIRKSREFFNIDPRTALEIFEDVARLLDDAEIIRADDGLSGRDLAASVTGHAEKKCEDASSEMNTVRYGRNGENREYFRAWALARERFTLDDLHAEAKERGYIKTNCSRCLMGANDVCVRVDENHFVPDGEVPFDIDAIDSALDKIVGKYALPYVSMRACDYQSLPPVRGHSWNPYLLTSFCWRFSRLFEHLCFCTYPHQNIVGVMARKECGYRKMYHEKAFEMLLCNIVRDAKIQLDGDVIDRWLMENCWIGHYSGAGKRIVTRLSHL